MVIRYFLFALLGVAFWTFMEYIIHRFLGHQKRGKNIIRQEHLRHHAEAHYFAPLYKKLLLAILVLSTSTLLFGIIFNWLTGFSFSLGLAGMYVIYEVTHRRFHIKDPLLRYGLRMRKHHFYHHFGNPKLNHGVTTAIWDRVFGTFEKTTVIRVPDKIAMNWLRDGQDNLKPRYKRHFQIY